MKNIQKGKGFTLVEVLVVITILAVLWTIWFLTFTKYTSNARDTTRKVDISNITNVLSLHYAKRWSFPEPSDSFDVTYTWATVWTQWTFGDDTQRELWKIIWNLQDPLYGNFYSYSTTRVWTEYQLWVLFERVNPNSENILSQLNPSDYNFINTAIASYPYYDPSELDPKIWLDGADIDGDGNITNNPVDWTTITNWVNKWTIWVLWNPTTTHGTVTYEDDTINGMKWPLIQKADWLMFNNSDITTGEIYYVLHDSWWKASGYALQGTVKNYTIWSYKNYRNALNINWGPNHLNTAPAIKNSTKRKAFFYSYITDDSNYEFRNTGNLISLWSANSISWITWAINKAWWNNRNNELADWWVGEVLIFDAELSEDDRFKVEWYLAHKWWLSWDLSITHPYKETPPPPWWDETEPVEEIEKTGVYVTGNYNGLFAHTQTGGLHYVISTPSIMTYDDTENDILKILEDRKLVYDSYWNIPASYKWANLTMNGGFEFYTTIPLLFEWTRDELTSYESIKSIDSWILAIYSNFVEYDDVSHALEDSSLNYVENILWNIVWINPIKPYYCIDILDSKLERNIAQLATVSDGLGNAVWELTNLEIQTESEYIASRINETLVFDFDTVQDIWYVRIYNNLWPTSSSFSGAEIRLFDEYDTILYSHTLWDTTDDYVIDLDLEWISESHDAKSMEIQVLNWNTFSAREVEIFTAWNVESGFYKVDDDGYWWKQSYQVYCDMETDGWWWTKVGNNYVFNWNFSEWQHAKNADITIFNSNNQIVNIATPWSNNFALRQASNTSSSWIYYQLDFNNTNAMEAGRELVFKSWVRYDWGTVSTVDPFNYFLEYESWVFETWGITTTIDSQIILWNMWELKEMRIPLLEDVKEFTWNLGKWINKNSSRTLYVSDLSLEIYFK